MAETLHIRGTLGRRGRVHVTMFIDDEAVGDLYAVREPINEVDCKDDVEVLADKLDRDLDAVWVVHSSQIVEYWRGRGFGIEMYVAAVELLGSSWPGAALAAGACVLGYPDEFYSSEDAIRVWKSQGVDERVVIEGLVATTRQGVEYKPEQLPVVQTRDVVFGAPDPKLKRKLMR